MIHQLEDAEAVLESRGGAAVLVSRRYGDIYFSAADGLAETRMVFLDGNNLPQRFAHCQSFTIAETGFGSALNFLVTLDACSRSSQKPPVLHYIATELAPLDTSLLKQCHNVFFGNDQIMMARAERLRAALPARWPGPHRLHFAAGEIAPMRVTLDLLYGDTAAMLADADFRADAWFLDGFAPARNPAHWSDGVFAEIARLSAPSASFASFTAAGAVREGLSRAGFQVERLPGFGNKRHRIRGWLKHGAADTPASSSRSAGQIVIIGGGIAAGSIAAGLRRRGRNPLLLDAGSSLATGASGNPVAMQTPRLTVDDTAAGRLSLAAYGYARRLTGQTAASASHSGIAIQLAWKQTEAERQRKLLARGWPEDLIRFAGRHEISSMLGCDAGYDGVVFAAGGTVSPPRLTGYLAGGSEILQNAVVTGIQRYGHAWQVRLEDGRLIAADQLVLAAGSGLASLLESFEELPILPLAITRGCLSYAARADWLQNGVSFGGYLAPDDAGGAVLGAGFTPLAALDRQIMLHPLPVSTAEHEANLQLLPTAVRDRLVAAAVSMQGRASYRLSTADRQPLAGAVAEGLWVLGGLGARGMVTAPLLGEHLAARLCDEPSPLGRMAAMAVEPVRFARRAARRSNRRAAAAKRHSG